MQKAVRNEIPPTSSNYNLHFLLNAYIQKAVSALPLQISLELMFPPIDMSNKAKAMQEIYDRNEKILSMKSCLKACEELKALIPSEVFSIDLNIFI